LIQILSGFGGGSHPKIKRLQRESYLKMQIWPGRKTTYRYIKPSKAGRYTAQFFNFLIIEYE